MKYEIELADDHVDGFLNDLRNGLGGDQAVSIAAEIEAQIPVPAPTLIGAVVRTRQGSFTHVYIRWAWDVRTTAPWIHPNDVDETYRTDEIGRIIEVLAPGVPLP